MFRLAKDSCPHPVNAKLNYLAQQIEESEKTEQIEAVLNRMNDVPSQLDRITPCFEVLVDDKETPTFLESGCPQNIISQRHCKALIKPGHTVALYRKMGLDYVGCSKELCLVHPKVLQNISSFFGQNPSIMEESNNSKVYRSFGGFRLLLYSFGNRIDFTCPAVQEFVRRMHLT
uniref:Uncharacterized protein n=1 Tax=Romanomermis culicivorax TaxID=13658 RepID=A0A915JQI3_ROMCU